MQAPFIKDTYRPYSRPTNPAWSSRPFGSPASGYGIRSAGAVIWMTQDNHLGAVQLLRQHGAHQEMRPGQGAERQHEVGPVDHRLIQALGPANQETYRPGQVGPLPQLCRQCLTAKRAAAQVKWYREGVAR